MFGKPKKAKLSKDDAKFLKEFCLTPQTFLTPNRVECYLTLHPSEGSVQMASLLIKDLRTALNHINSGDSSWTETAKDLTSALESVIDNFIIYEL